MIKSKIAWRILAVLILSACIPFSCRSANAQQIAPKISRATEVSWEKVSDEQLARFFFPKESVYLRPPVDELSMANVDRGEFTCMEFRES
jgi:hypothetical protein